MAINLTTTAFVDDDNFYGNAYMNDIATDLDTQDYYDHLFELYGCTYADDYQFGTRMVIEDNYATYGTFAL